MRQTLGVQEGRCHNDSLVSVGTCFLFHPSPQHLDFLLRSLNRSPKMWNSPSGSSFHSHMLSASAFHLPLSLSSELNRSARMGVTSLSCLSANMAERLFIQRIVQNTKHAKRLSTGLASSRSTSAYVLRSCSTRFATFASVTTQEPTQIRGTKPPCQYIFNVCKCNISS